MSLILKGIDMPNCSNEDCIVVIRKDKAEVWQTGFKERTVEAIQIPKDHGNIIDSKDILIPVRCIPKTIMRVRQTIHITTAVPRGIVNI